MDGNSYFDAISWLVPASIVAIAIAYACWARARMRSAERRISGPLQDTIRQQKQQLRQVRDVDDSRNLFLGSLSHELRTPLSGITGAVHLLEATELDVRQREYARMIRYASRTVLEIVDDMLAFSRLHAGNDRIERVCFSPRIVLEDMLALQGIKAQERKLALVQDIADDVPSMVMGDRGKLNQILLNIIGNAIKFTDEGSIVVSVRMAPDAAAEHSQNTARLVFEVCDTGIGLETPNVDALLRPFVQGHGNNRTERGGTGLGLAICKRLIDAMGGTLELQSARNQGTCVRFTLTFWRVARTQASDQKTRASEHSGRSLTVLVVEDDEINRLVCTRYLALLGHHPLAAADAAQMQQLVKTSTRAPDVILMDINLGGHSGTELAEQLAAGHDRRWQAVPIIAMSADTSGAAQRRARAAHMAAFMAKPFTSPQLQAALATVIAESADMRAKIPSPGQSRPHQEPQLLDYAYLQQETDDLGPDIQLELLNIFRSNAASQLQMLARASQRHDWDALATHAHALQGAAASLGMQAVANCARGLQHQLGTQAPGVLSDDSIQHALRELEQACHDSADAVRAFLLRYLGQ